ncbi:MAG: HNH endonuclease [Chloroflexota bacterium]|nr:HNH endonuclease [Chloroflexota bacterium]
MEIELDARHRQVLGLEKLREKRGYKDGWLYHLCRQKGLLGELQELQVAGLIGDAPTIPFGMPQQAEPEIGKDGELLLPRTRLTVELVPSSCWFSNLRSELSKEDWDRLRHAAYERAGRRCKVCGQRGSQHPVECHEVWEYDDERHVQRLTGLMALCPACHEAKHMGYASSVGRAGQARAHLARVNGWSMDMVELYLEVQFEQWSRRSNHEWLLDLSWLRQFGIEATSERSGEGRKVDSG